MNYWLILKLIIASYSLRIKNTQGKNVSCVFLDRIPMNDANLTKWGDIFLVFIRAMTCK